MALERVLPPSWEVFCLYFQGASRLEEGRVRGTSVERRIKGLLECLPL